MHLMIFLDIAKPTWIERTLVLLGQGAFLFVYTFLYILSSKTAHRVVGYFEEEACKSYTEFLEKLIRVLSTMSQHLKLLETIISCHKMRCYVTLYCVFVKMKQSTVTVTTSSLIHLKVMTYHHINSKQITN